MKLWSCFFVTVTGLCLLAAAGPVRAVEDGDLERLLDAIAEVESNNEAKAVGDGGRAVGTYQIHRLYWADGTRFLGVDWKYREARNPQKARAVVRAYLRHYGRNKSLLEMARIHNGGPRGYRKVATLEYARKIEAALESTAQARDPAGTSHES